MAWIIFLIILALFFDYLNGFHDAANAVSTVISTRVLSPRLAVWWAAFFNFVAFLIFKTAVAKTIGAGIVDINVVDANLVFGALVGACSWNLITWWFGLPSSSSHALIGGLIGAGFLKGGVKALVAGGIFKTVLFIFIAPLMGQAHPDYSPLAQTLVKLAIVLVFGALCSYLHSRLMINVSQGTMLKLRTSTFYHM